MKNTEKKEYLSNTWEKLGISNDFLFGKVMQDATLCTKKQREIENGGESL